jgi:hypothetical protein
MKTFKHTVDSFRLAKYLTKYQGEWHSISNDAQTQKALTRLMRVVKGHYEIVTYDVAQTQVKYFQEKVA